MDDIQLKPQGNNYPNSQQMQVSPEFSRNEPIKVTTYELETPKQFRALFLKSASLQKKRTWTNCCQIALPLVLILVIGVTNILLGNLTRGSSGRYSKHVSDNIVREEPYLATDISRTYNYFIYSNDAKYPNLGNLYSNGSGSGMLGELISFQRQFSDKQPDQVPYFFELESQGQINSYMQDLKENMYQRRLTRSGDIFNLTYSEPTSAVAFTKVDEVTMDLEYNVQYEDDSTFLFLNGQVNTYFSLSTAISTLNYVHNAFLRYFTNSNYTIITYVQALPYREIETGQDLSGTIAGTLLPFALSFLFPVWVFNNVQEKEDKLVEMQKMAGVKMIYYYGVTFLFNFFLYSIIVVIVVGIGLAFKLPFFLEATGWLTFLMFVGWGINQISLSFLMSTFFSKARTSIIVSYILVIISILCAIIVESIAFADKEANTGYFIWPPFAFYHYLSLTGNRCGTNCPTNKDLAPGKPYSNILLFLYIEAFFFMLFAVYFDNVLPKQFGVRRSPIFPCLDLYRFITGKRRRRNSISLELSELSTNAIGANTDADVEDEDVRVEKMMINDETTAAYPVIIKGLNKEYPKKTAIKRLNLSLKANECFGLLGPNGAGKTTTISICTGLYMPTDGTAYIVGHDIRSEMDAVHQSIGICPQFDILWESLSCLETLLFYSRVKGVPKNLEITAATDCLKQVNLLAAKDKLVSELSGGMKRRLSVAVSLVGNPKVIFMDEPTTGLDPDSRRSLWEVLLQVKPGKCLILTTHSMEEADILTDRIGIMSRGELRVIGSNIHLKNKYGEGYSLKISFDEQKEDQVRDYIKQILPDARLIEEFPGNHTYQMSSQGFVMSELLHNFIAGNDLIKDWGISQTTLEDVFLNIVKTDEQIKD